MTDAQNPTVTKLRGQTVAEGSNANAVARTNSSSNMYPAVGTIDKQGFLSKRNKGFLINSWKDKYFVLCGETLYYYKTKEEQVPRGVVHLRSSVLVDLTERKAKRKFAFCIQTPKDDFFLSAKDDKDKEEWLALLLANSARDFQLPPDRSDSANAQLHNQGGRKYAVQGHLVDTLTRFGPGKRLVLSFITDDTLALMDAVKSFVSKVDGEAQAQALEKSIISVGFKVAMLYQEKKIPKEYFLALRDPMHRMCDKLIDGYELPFLYNAPEVLASIEIFRQCLEKTLAPYFNEKTMKKMGTVFDYFKKEQLLDDFFTKRKWQECADMAEVLRRLWEAGRV